ncbi:uncharacterized protein LOC115365877 [Myripristis murdjan]|uniref:uncharacterized protein LOC115365877 n=1 Tax=Myripristis murdjan TaxID=586833 RepID=UPI001176274A|nr:uncharacterized protein LOC115365877 [Myripristis murdjan]
MGSLAGGRLDEAHCFRPMCTHPGCWQAEQRILTGKPRMTEAQASSRATARACDMDEFPTLSVVNASKWTEGRRLPEVKSLRREDDISQGATSTLSSLEDLPRGGGRHVSAHYPKCNAATTTLVETNRDNKTVKLSTAQIHPLSSCNMSQCSEVTVMWIPNPHYIPPQHPQNSVKSPQVAIKELICLPPVDCSKAGAKKKRLTREKSREWVQFHRTHLMSPLMEEERGSLSSGPGADLPDPGSAWASPNSDLQVGEATVSPRDSLLVPVDQSLRAVPEAENGGRLPRTASTFHVTTKPVVFHPVWERMQRRHTPEDHPAYKYKLDTKTAVDGIDWESLKRQTYLWRNHFQAANRERGQPPSLKTDAGYLHAAPKPTLDYGPKGPPSTGPAKCWCMSCMNGMWQSYSRLLASPSELCVFRNDAFKSCCATHPVLKLGHQAVDEDGESETALDMRGFIPPPNSKHSSQDKPSVEPTKLVELSR